MGKKNIVLLLILLIGFGIRLYKLPELMPFIGDYGWFYLSARDMIVNGEVPLVGIPSSHPWLHQGPLWTYMLAGAFGILGFDPINGAYLTVILGVFTILLIYIVGSEIFSKRIGLMSALLYATSPLAVVYSRSPYHTSPIPLFTLLYIFSLYKFIKGNNIFFPLAILFLSILYNLELATAILWFILFIVLIYGMWRKTEWLKRIISRKILIFSFLAFLIPMFPIIIYDFSNNFSQTLKFIVWIGYRILKFFGFPSIHEETDVVNLGSMFTFSFQFYQSLIFAVSSVVSLVILIVSFSMLFINAYSLVRRRIKDIGFILLFLWILISSVGYFINKTPSEAYLPIFFPALIYLVAYSFDKLMQIRILIIPCVLLICILSSVNTYSIIFLKYFTNNGLSFSNRLSAAKEIVKKARGRNYNIVGIGVGSQFESFTMNYEYLAWWLGHSPSRENKNIKIYISESKNRIKIE